MQLVPRLIFTGLGGGWLPLPSFLGGLLKPHSTGPRGQRGREGASLNSGPASLSLVWLPCGILGLEVPILLLRPQGLTQDQVSMLQNTHNQFWDWVPSLPVPTTFVCCAVCTHWILLSMGSARIFSFDTDYLHFVRVRTCTIASYSVSRNFSLLVWAVLKASGLQFHGTLPVTSASLVP